MWFDSRRGEMQLDHRTPWRYVDHLQVTSFFGTPWDTPLFTKCGRAQLAPLLRERAESEYDDLST